MIHSLSGGVLSSGENFTFVKVEISGAPYWYIAPFHVEAGDRVLVPFGKEERIVEGTVLKTENCTQQTAPFPVNRTRRLWKRLDCE